MELCQRKANRLDGYDYGRAGYYFITVCTAGRNNFFWDFSIPSCVGADIIRPCLPALTQYGRCADQAVQNISLHYTGIWVDKYVIMPNHLHMILVIEQKDRGRIISAPTKGIPIIVGQMKRSVSKNVGFPIWQKSYHDHIIRNEADYRRIWHYIDTNPAHWHEDCFYTVPNCNRNELE